MNILNYPFDNREILKKKKALRRQLLQQSGLLEIRIAILSGSTVGDVKDILELFLLNFGIMPKFYIGQYNRFYEDVMFENYELVAFKPELIYVHTSMRNLSDNAIMEKLQTVWTKIKEDFSCPIIQNNFELPNRGCEVKCYEINNLNAIIADYAEANKYFYINDIQYLSAQFGLERWFNEQDYFLYKFL